MRLVFHSLLNFTGARLEPHHVDSSRNSQHISRSGHVQFKPSPSEFTQPGSAFAYRQNSCVKKVAKTGSQADPRIIRRAVRDAFERIHMINV